MGVLRPSASVLFLVAVLHQSYAQIPDVARWCCASDAEKAKCDALVEAIKMYTVLNRNTTVTIRMNQYTYQYINMPTLSCVQGADQFNCMQMIFNGDADLMQLETGLSYTAGEYYNMMPLMAEKYVLGTGDEGLKFLAVAITRKDNKVSFNTLKGARTCLPGVGQAAGWIYPISTLMEREMMDIVECNVPVKSAVSFFGDMCAPDGLQRYYNPFSNNPVQVCKKCQGVAQDYCTCNDPYANYQGAISCVANGDGDVTFVRNTTVFEFITNGNTTLTADDFQLICTDNTRTSVDQAATCNWGTISSHVVMTALVRDPSLRQRYKVLLQMLDLDFGTNGVSNDLFKLYESIPYGRQDLMFTDETLQLKDISSVAGGTLDSYFLWAGPELKRRIVVMNMCPVQQARWCVISNWEMAKCENMIMAFAAKNLKPDLNCIMAQSVQECMQKIQTGDADLVTLDPADVYTAGKYYSLVPIAMEDYQGSDNPTFYAVAVARKRDLYLTLFNLKQRRTCHSAVWSAAGWVVPVDVLIHTGQINVENCDAFLAVGQYFSKSCVPGALSHYYNPYKTNPISLCEACETRGPKRCLRNDEELNYGASGAFRCLTQLGGDVAWVRHTTVRENTDYRNPSDWSRNRRSDDYELLCNDGTRTDIDSYKSCYLAELPTNAIVTAAFKSQKERDIFWTLMNFGQQFYDADTNPDFAMFDSTIDHKDLIFQDATVRLVKIAPDNQTYELYLKEDFMRAMQRMETVDCVTGSYAVPLLSSAATYCVCLLSFVAVRLFAA